MKLVTSRNLLSGGIVILFLVGRIKGRHITLSDPAEGASRVSSSDKIVFSSKSANESDRTARKCFKAFHRF